MTYLEWIEKNGLWSKWCAYRYHHLNVSKNRALRSFCLKHGCPFARDRRKHDSELRRIIQIAKVNLYELH